MKPKKKAKGGATRKPLVTLRNTLEGAKKHRENAEKQALLCETVLNLVHKDPYLLQYDNFESEIPLCVCLALKTHPTDETLRHGIARVLCTLLRTPCFEHVFRFGGAAALTSILQTDVANEYVLDTILSTFSGLANFRKTEQTYERLGKAGFNEAVVLAMKTHPQNASIQFSGGDALARMTVLCNNADSSLLQGTVEALLASVENSHAEKSPAAHHCEVLSNLMVRCPEIVRVVGAADGPQKVLTMMKNHPDDFMMQGSGSLVLCYFTSVESLQEECIQQVVSALKRGKHHPHARQRSVSFLVKMIETQSGSVTLLSSGNIPFLIGLMQEYKDFEVQTIGCWIVRCLFARQDKTGEFLSTTAGAGLVVRALKMAETESLPQDMYAAALVALESVLVNGDTDEATNVIMTTGGIQSVTVGMKWTTSEHDSMDLIMCTILRELASSERDDVKLDFAAQGGSELVLLLLKRNLQDKQIQECGCKALGMLTILKQPAIFRPIATADGVNILLDAVEKYPKEKVIFNYGGSAALLVREFENRQKRKQKAWIQ